MDIKERLIELLNIHGVSGNEKPVSDYLAPILSDIMDEVVIDGYGNLLGTMKAGTGTGATILLSAHMDTVKGVRADKIVIESDGIVRAELPDGSRAILGADDRAGIAIALDVLKYIPESFDGIIKVAFSREEEIGCIGADKISTDFLKGIDLAIVIDRRGNRDIVVGSSVAFCSDAVGDFIEHMSELQDMDWECVQGGMSDAMVFASRGINSINLSTGYDNEHTIHEYVSIPNMLETSTLITQALAVVNRYVKGFGGVPNANKWVGVRRQYFDDEDILWEEQMDLNGDMFIYGVDNDVVFIQGENEIRIERDNLKEIYEKVSFALAKHS